MNSLSSSFFLYILNIYKRKFRFSKREGRNQQPNSLSWASIPIFLYTSRDTNNFFLAWPIQSFEPFLSSKRFRVNSEHFSINNVDRYVYMQAVSIDQLLCKIVSDRPNLDKTYNSVKLVDCLYILQSTTAKNKKKSPAKPTQNTYALIHSVPVPNTQLLRAQIKFMFAGIIDDNHMQRVKRVRRTIRERRHSRTHARMLVRTCLHMCGQKTHTHCSHKR